MATNTAGTSARQYTTAQVHYHTKAITFADAGTTVNIGYVPAGGYVLRAYVVVTTAFNGDTTNTLDIGTAADTDGFATDLALGTIGVISADEMATTNDSYCAADTLLQGVVVSTASASAGAGLIVVEYVLPM